jgi:DAK2 domain fusion protein YloV
MATLEGLVAGDLRAVVTGFRDALRAHQARINRLNVYPVPDGDTGTNMALTLESVVAELDETEGVDLDMAAACKAIAHGSLMGARGNSGVILSQILRGLTSACAERETVDATVLAEGLVAAADGAYAAVGRPVEGTILTVVRELSEAAKASAADGASLLEMLDAARVAGRAALDRTPELLPVLKEAGVVDAGGAGLLLLLDSALHVVDGRAMPRAEAQHEPVVLVSHGAPAPMQGGGGIADLRYEVMYLLDADDETIPAFKQVWAGIGDSIVVVGGDGLWNCHIHTDDIGAAIEASLDAGRPRNIRVTDLLDELEEEAWVRGAEPEAEIVYPEVTTAIVAVATGDGVRRIFHSLGVQQVVTGGQSMNPSTAQLLEAVEAAPATEVVIFPNNKNIIAVAEQVDELTEKTVRVLRTRSVTEGFAGLLAYDPDADSATNAEEMQAAADRVLAGEVAQAVRSSTFDGGPIAEGDWMGIDGAGIRCVDKALAAAVTGLLDLLVTDDHEIITLIEGEGSSAGDTRTVTEWVAEHRPGVEVEVHHGGQPLYPYLIGIE